jgi:alpha-galactosidase
VNVRAGAIGTAGEIAIQVGEAGSWCQGGCWAWTGPGQTHTVAERYDQLGCPQGVTVDITRIHAVWVFLNGGGTLWIDDLRAE